MKRIIATFVLLVSCMIAAGCAGGAMQSNNGGISSGTGQGSSGTLQATACADPTTPLPASYSKEWIYAADITETPYVYGFAIDPSTGALTSAAWSPAGTNRNPHSLAVDAQGRFLYVGSDNPFANPDRMLETYSVDASSGHPTFVNYQTTGYPADIGFDPTFTTFYLVDPVGLFSSTAPTGSTIQPYLIGSDGVPIKNGPPGEITPAYGGTFGFKLNGGLVLLSRDSEMPESNGSIRSFQRNCSTGALTPMVNFAYSKGLRLISVPTQGNYFVGYDCAGSSTPGSQLFSVDSGGNIAAVQNGFIPGVCSISSNHSSTFMAAAMHSNPSDQYSPSDTLVLYRFDNAAGTLTETDRYQFPAQLDSAGGYVKPLLGLPTFDLTDHFIYVSLTNQLAGFSYDSVTGKLSPVPGSPITTNLTFQPMIVAGTP